MADVPQSGGPQEIVYQGRIIEVVEMPMKIGDKKVTFEKARRAPGVRLILHDKQAKTVILSREYRTELQDYDYRLPGGKVFDRLEDYNKAIEISSDILVAASKKAIEEAEEEVGAIIKDPEHVYTSVCGATMQWDLYYFSVDSYILAGQKLEAGEDISFEAVPLSDLQEVALTKMSEDRSVAALLRWMQSLDNK